MVYGLTEFGIPVNFPGTLNARRTASERLSAFFCLAKPHKEGGDWLKFSFQVEPILVPQDEDPNVYEVVMKVRMVLLLLLFSRYCLITPNLQDTELFHITNFTSEIDGVPVYETNDLVVRHPDNPELFKIIGRKDDQIMLSTGEKVRRQTEIKYGQPLMLIGLRPTRDH